MKKLECKRLIFVDDVKEADLITHSAKFHADEVFSTLVLINLDDKEEYKICRINEVKDNSNGFVYDIGGGKYDHHQVGGNGDRDNGIRYCSFGLIWRDFGIELLKLLEIDNYDEVFKIIDMKLVEVIDAYDNGQILSYNSEYSSICSIVSLFNPNWDMDVDSNVCFYEAVDFACVFFNKLLDKINAKLKAKSLVEKEISKSKDNILILDKYMPWKDILLESSCDKAKDILFVIFPSNRGGYNISAVPTGNNEFESRMLFPISWAGLRDSDFVKVCGVSSATFCHNGRFLCNVKKLEDAIILAKKAIDYVK